LPPRAPFTDDQIGDTLRRRGEGECFESFSKAFEGEKFRKGTVITLSSKNGTVTTFIDGRKKVSAAAGLHAIPYPRLTD